MAGSDARRSGSKPGVLDLVEQGPVADVERLRRADAVPAGLLEAFEDGLPLGRLGGLPGDVLERDRAGLGAVGAGAVSSPFARLAEQGARVRSGSPSTIMRLIMFSSSRTLPGKLWRIKRSIVSGGSVKPSRWKSFA